MLAMSTALTDPTHPDSISADAMTERSRESTFLSRATLVTLFLATAMNPIQIIVPDTEIDRGIDGFEPITLAKLGIAALAVTIGAWGFLNGAAVRRLFATATGSLLAMLAITFVVTSIFAFADAAAISRAASLIFLGYVLFIAVAVTIVELRQIVATMTLGSIAYLLATWMVYLAMPSIGHFVEYTDAFNSVIRMGGTAHPNGIAREACIMMILCGCFLRPGVWREHRPMMRCLLWMAMVLGLATLSQTMSRTAMAAGWVAMVALIWDRLWTRAGMTAVMAGTTIALVIFLGGLLVSRDQSGADRIATYLTKSGSVNEITSLTGRTEIWAEAVGLISQRPISGWGLDSAASLMGEHAMGTHNLLLHFLFSGGIFSALILVALLIATAVIAWTSSQPIFRAIAAYIFVSAILEDTLVESFPTCLTMLWVILLLHPSAMAIRDAALQTGRSLADDSAATPHGRSAAYA